ncbi:FemAB family protein [Flavimaricola marinus]|uniref:FemAB family protein n=2 Tax=Flavimaricola marinus TaxID=1819565 RepID=A0A238LDE0_9RHOB|nr:FemAB family protein [Flavimaricola marinus]
MLPLQQHPLYGKAVGLMGRHSEIVPLCANGADLGEAQIVWRDMGPLGIQGLLPRGPQFEAGTPDQQAEALRSLSGHGLRMIEAEAPHPALRAAGYVQVLTPAHMAELPLDGTKADRRARAHPKWRASLRKAEAAGLKLRTQPYRGQPGHWLLDREAAARKTKGYHGLPAVLPLALGQADPNALRMFWAEKAGEPVAGMLFVRHGQVATYLTGWTGQDGRNCCAHHLLMMTAADWLAARGHRRLDMGQVDTRAASGLARFKIGSGAAVRALGGSWLRLPFCGRPRKVHTGKAMSKPLNPLDTPFSSLAAHDKNDPRTLRKPRPADDRAAANDRSRS